MKNILEGYLECALLSSTQDNDSPFGDDYGIEDISAESIKSAEKDIQDFVALLKDEKIEWENEITECRFGYEFWLTRNHHGSGFWDMGLGELGKKLTEWAHSYGSSDVYLGDDGVVYLS